MVLFMNSCLITVCSKLPGVRLKLAGPCLHILIFKSLFNIFGKPMWMSPLLYYTSNLLCLGSVLRVISIGESGF
jgi:hypothetical protein